MKKEQKPIKAVFIDVKNKTVTDIEIVPTLENYYKQLGVDIIQPAYPEELKQRNFLYVDEEGLLKGGQHFFQFGNYPQPLAGNAVVVRAVGANERDTTYTADQIRPMVTFLGELQPA